MAKKEFILQGFTKRTHLDAIAELFDVANIERVLIGVAFVNENGVEKIEGYLKPHAPKTTIFAGIRNDITSFQGLSRLHGIVGKRLITVDTGSRIRIFHPKVFLVRGKTKARMLIGSANLTLGGLHNNVEASVGLDLDLKNPEDLAIVDDMCAKLDSMLVEHPKHVTAIDTLSVLKSMLDADRIIDEEAAPPPRLISSKGIKSGKDNIEPINFKLKPLRGTTKKAKAVTKKTITVASATSKTPSYLGGLAKVWESKPLSGRSLNVRTGSNTNPTGSTTLGKGSMNAIDPTTYFRNDIFGHLAWEDYKNRAGNDAQKADADFEIAIKGIPIGRFTLTLRHSLTRVAAAKADKNLPTELSWNDARPYISRSDLIGRTMSLYRDVSNPLLFAIEID